MEQSGKIAKLSIPDTQKRFSSEREMEQYICVKSRPEICTNVQLIVPGADETKKEELTTLGKLINNLQESNQEGLTFAELYMDSI